MPPLTVCYFIQSHHGREQIVRLARTLRRSSPSASIVVGHDSGGCPLDGEDFAGIGGVEFFRFPGPAMRGRLSLIEPYFLALERLRERTIPHDWLVYLSGQDYPLRPLPEIEAFLAASGSDGFLTYGEAFTRANPMGGPWRGRLRYGFQYWTPPARFGPLLEALRWVNRLQRIAHVHTSFEPRVGVRWLRSPFGPARRCYAGSQWTTLRRPCTDYLLERWRLDRDLVRYYRRTIVPDESLVQTLLVNGGRFRLTNDNLRYADLAGGRDGRPRLLAEGDFAMLTAGPWHFARKFDAGAHSRVFDRLDTRIFGSCRLQAEGTGPGLGI